MSPESRSGKNGCGNRSLHPFPHQGKKKGFYVSPEYIGPYQIVKDCLEGFVVLGCHGRMVSLLDIKSSDFFLTLACELSELEPQPASHGGSGGGNGNGLREQAIFL
jgi:hypothetical protein